MKRRESKEPDLYVVNKKPTEKELKELSVFIDNYKKQQSLKRKKHKRAA
jgi:mevalonate pyrophosphate decarboxylase